MIHYVDINEVHIAHFAYSIEFVGIQAILLDYMQLNSHLTFVTSSQNIFRPVFSVQVKNIEIKYELWWSRMLEHFRHNPYTHCANIQWQTFKCNFIRMLIVDQLKINYHLKLHDFIHLCRRWVVYALSEPDLSNIVTHSMTFHGIMQSTWGQPDAIFDMHALARISLLNVDVNFHWIEIVYIDKLFWYFWLRAKWVWTLTQIFDPFIYWFNLKHILFLNGKEFSRFLEAISVITSLEMFCSLGDNIWMCSHNCYPDVCQFQMKSDSIACQSNDFFAWFFQCAGIELVHWFRSIWWDIKPLLFIID